MIMVLRLGHRAERDKRISTHAGLVARSFGADKIIFTGDHDKKLLDSINGVSKEWGGIFSAEYSKDYKKTIKEHPACKIVHLTMYGKPVQQEVKKFRGKDLLVIIGGEKVPPDVYELADYNVSVTSQPHSEIAALAILLDQYYEGSELNKEYKGAKKTIIPQKKGKKVVTK